MGRLDKWLKIGKDGISEPSQEELDTRLEQLAKTVEGNWEEGQNGFFGERDAVSPCVMSFPTPHSDDQGYLASVRNTDQVDWSQWEDKVEVAAKQHTPITVSSAASWSTSSDEETSSSSSSLSYETSTSSTPWETPGFPGWQFTQNQSPWHHSSSTVHQGTVYGGYVSTSSWEDSSSSSSLWSSSSSEPSYETSTSSTP